LAADYLTNLDVTSDKLGCQFYENLEENLCQKQFVFMNMER